jgi:hypothetical protein
MVSSHSSNEFHELKTKSGSKNERIFTFVLRETKSSSKILGVVPKCCKNFPLSAFYLLLHLNFFSLSKAI